MIEFGNSIVTLKSDNGDTYIIYKGDEEAVGQVVLMRQEPASFYVEIQEPHRGMHFASNAVFLLTAFAHQELRLKRFEIVLDKRQEMMRHILEHGGYQMAAETDSYWNFTHEKETTLDATAFAPQDGEKVIYLAGGCFWGTERAFKVLRGVTSTMVGYANGQIQNPTYEEVCRNDTGFRECVRVTYDPETVTLATVLDAYFIVTDPTQENRQGNDIGSQYQSGIYFKDAEDETVIREYLENIKDQYPSFHVECRRLESFYEAEEYHQDYLTKHPNGYCHVTLFDIEKIKAL